MRRNLKLQNEKIRVKYLVKSYKNNLNAFSEFDFYFETIIFLLQHFQLVSWESEGIMVFVKNNKFRFRKQLSMYQTKARGIAHNSENSLALSLIYLN